MDTVAAANRAMAGLPLAGAAGVALRLACPRRSLLLEEIRGQAVTVDVATIAWGYVAGRILWELLQAAFLIMLKLIAMQATSEDESRESTGSTASR